MSRWTHSTCDSCFTTRYPDSVGHRMREPEQEVCCFCGQDTTSGLYIREDPEVAACQLQTPVHQD